MPRISPYVAGILIVLLAASYARCADDVSSNDALRLAIKIQRAIIEIDMKTIDGMITDMYFVDEVYERSDVIELLYDKYSWLYRMLFAENDSVREYYVSAQNLEYEFHWNEQIKDHITILYKSSNFPREKWPECSLTPVGGVMVFDNLFVY